MKNTFTHDTYLSPLTWRYGSDEMRTIWSESNKRKLWRQIWVALADAERGAGLVTPEQLEDLRLHQNNINLERAHEIEAEIRHDLMAEVKTYAEQCLVGGGIIHLGATSMDIEDNAEVLRTKESLKILQRDLRSLLVTLARRIEEQAEVVCMAFTHLQPAEPTTIGYRLAGYAQDLLADFESISMLSKNLRGKGFKGAVGTSASYQELLAGTSTTPHTLEKQIMDSLGLDAFPIATQTYPRRQDWEVLNTLAGLAMSVYRIAFDLRILQSPPFGEWAEPFGTAQVGSSAMPFKRNPINAENLNSLARYLAALPHVAWDNAAHSLLERTLDDSANRRVVFPEAFLIANELIMRLGRIIEGLKFDNQTIAKNLNTYGVFAATERLMMEAVKCGGSRQELHEIIRQHSLAAWDALKAGTPNPLAYSLCHDKRITDLVETSRVSELLNADTYVGDAPERARTMATQIIKLLGTS